MMMKFKYIFFLIFSAGIGLSTHSQNYTITWQRTIGGNNFDKLTSVVQTSDGGTILCGHSNSDISGDKLQNSVQGAYDYWIVKLNAAGSTQWSKTYGGNDRDLYPNIIQTSDGGYLIGGSSISPSSGSKTEDAVNKSFDYWVIKLDDKGDKEWDNTIGGIQFEKLAAVLETSSGYYICGSSNSTYGDDKTVPNEGSSLWPDYWVVKLNNNGIVQWDSTYGSKNRDELTAAKITPDGGLILGGSSYSPKFSDKSEDYFGNNDYWVVKLDAKGHKEFDITLGGSLSDYLTSLDVVNNNGYILAGYSNSPASFTKTDGVKGAVDYWIVRLNKQGNVLWDKTYGGKDEDYAISVKSSGKDFLVGGFSKSKNTGDKTSDSKGGYDFWTLILNKNGNLVEQNAWGGKDDDLLIDYEKSDANSYLLAGISFSDKGKDKGSNTVGKTGNPDYWVFKISQSGKTEQLQSTQPVTADSKVENMKPQLSLNINPNPVKDVIHLDYRGSDNTPSQTVSLYSNNGKLITQQALSQSSGTYTFNFSAQAAGVYYAVLRSGSSSITKKFIKN